MASHGLKAYFSAEEINRLQAGLPDLEQWSTRLLVPFQVHRLRNASIIWLNRRWFGERCLDLADDAALDRVSRWILGDFAYITPTNGAQVDADDVRTLHADRYGSSSGMATHGGSGRVAIDGRFQAKGVGQTPLVSVNSRAGHSHGCMSLMEAIREAIFGEVTAAEFPNEAVPIIAIIDTGLTFSSPDKSDVYDQHARRAIAIRPTAIRIAHAERAPLFKTSVVGYANKQSDDAQRAKEVIHTWMTSANLQATSRVELDVLRALLSTIVEQIAFGQVHRLFCGGFFSSNLTISGGLLDFGNMHALPDWSRAKVHSVVEGFGSEMSLLQNIVNSLSFHIAKYRGLGQGLALDSDFFDELDRKYVEAWKAFASGLFQMDQSPKSCADEIYQIIFDYFEIQQKTRSTYRFGEIVHSSNIGNTHWIYDGIINGKNGALGSHEARTLQRLDTLLRRTFSGTQRRVAWHTAARLLKPRRGLDRLRLLKELASLTSPARPKPSPASVQSYIAKVVDQGRRHWPRMPNGASILGHVVCDGSSALQTDLTNENRQKFWIEGLGGEGRNCHLFGQTFGESDAVALGLRYRAPYWSGFVNAVKGDGHYFIDLPRRNLMIPPMTVTYAPPSQDWLS
jgi:hypothetical protein